MTETTIDVINRLAPIAEDTDRLGELIGVPFPQWAHRCHEISFKLLKTGKFGPGRIARGTCTGVRGQHSWIILGNDCYNPGATVVDPTLWSYVQTQTGIFIGRGQQNGYHRPHGAGMCFEAGMPCTYGGDFIDLDDYGSLSYEAREFLDMLGPLDYRGWSEVAHLPVDGWPAREIIEAVLDTPALRALVPVDIVGMLTDRNPGGAYLAQVTP